MLMNKTFHLEEHKDQMWSFVKRFLCSVHFKRHREAG